MAINFIRISEAQKRLGLGRSTLYRLIKKGKLGPLVRIIPEDKNSPSALLEQHVEAYQRRVIEEAESGACKC